MNQAAHGMVPWAQYKMGMLYKDGLQMEKQGMHIVHRDLDEAIEWLQKAAEAKFAPATLQLAEAIALRDQQDSKERIEKLKRKATAEIQTSAATKPDGSNKRMRVLPRSASSVPLTFKNSAHTSQDASNIRLNFPTPSKPPVRPAQIIDKPSPSKLSNTTPISHVQVQQSDANDYEEGFPVGFDMNKHPSEFWK